MSFSSIDFQEEELLLINDFIFKCEEEIGILFFKSQYDRDAIIRNILICVDVKRLLYGDKDLDTNLVLSILKKSFLYASKNKHSEVTSGDVADSICFCCDIYDVKRRISRKKKASSLSLSNEQNSNDKVISYDVPYKRFK